MRTPFIAMALLLVPISGAAAETSCPKTHDGKVLTNIAVFDGPPEEQAQLMPDTSHESKNGEEASWDVAYVFQAGRKLFLQCQYGPDHAVVTVQTAATTRSCVYRGQGEKNLSLTCK